MIKRVWLYTIEHINEIIVITLFLIISYFIYKHQDIIFTKENFKTYAMPFVALLGIFLAWLQFIFHKYNKRKEAALTYFPRPLELENIENEIDQIINFWTRQEPLDNYEVRLMTGKEINNDEYSLIWKKISLPLKQEIINHFNNNQNNIENMQFDYEEKYNPYINELYITARRKLNAYLNQIEGYCLAINKGNIDLNSSKELFSHKFYNHFKKARPYIEIVRKDKQSPDLYIEYEIVLKKWGML